MNKSEKFCINYTCSTCKGKGILQAQHIQVCTNTVETVSEANSVTLSCSMRQINPMRSFKEGFDGMWIEYVCANCGEFIAQEDELFELLESIGALEETE